MLPLNHLTSPIRAQLEARVSSGDFQADTAQIQVADQLDQLLSVLDQSRLASKSSVLGWLFAARKKPGPVKGLYIHGSVGRGKTMLMDMFFALAPGRKRRAHFHEFMADVHERIAAHRQKLKSGETKQADPMPPVAASLFTEAELLCFDEFTVTDIADAMILSRLFSELFSLGCVLVATSNVAPDDLYRDGLNRGLFTPFIDLLKTHVSVVELDSPTDHRMTKLKSLPVYITPLGDEADQALNDAWSHVTDHAKPEPVDIPIKGRLLHVPAAVGRAARFSFSDLCEKPLAASDFLALCKRFDTIFIDHIPVLASEKRNQIKRFILLIDTFYDNHIHLYVSAAAKPADLLVDKKGTEGFEFARTASRLFEMQTAHYLNHTPKS